MASSSRKRRAPARRPQRQLPSLFIVGWGRVGSALGTQGRAAGLRLIGVETRDSARARKARRVVGGTNQLIREAELVALAVPEAAIAPVAAEMASRVRPGQVVFHLNGSVDLTPLAPLADAGALIASLHPYCSVASTQTPLRGATCAIDGGPKARAQLRRLALALGMRPLSPPRDRGRYHLSAVLTVAATGVAAAASERLLEAAGVSPAEARRALAAILRSVAFNVEHDSPGAALTGPFARGDLERIRSQLVALAPDPDATALYRTIGRLSAHLAPSLSPERREAIEALLLT